MLDKGNIIEEGTPSDLTSKSISYYAGLVTTAGIMLQNKNLSNKKQNTQYFIINPVLRLKTRSQTCVGGISHLNLVKWTLDMKNQ